MLSRGRLLAGIALVVLVASGCQVRTQIGIDVRDDGSGTVRVEMALDDDALSRVPDIADQLRTEDLEATGWTVTGPAKEADDLTWFRAEKPFQTPEEATAILAEVGGDAGPFRNFELTKTRSFARTQYSFAGTIDFTGGLESFGDAELADALEGEPLGEDIAAIEERIGEAVDRVFQFRVAIRLPGRVSSNAPGRAANGAVWEPTLSEPGPIELRASSETWRVGTLLWTGVAVVAGLGCVVTAVWLLVSRLRRGRRSPVADAAAP